MTSRLSTRLVASYVIWKKIVNAVYSKSWAPESFSILIIDAVQDAIEGRLNLMNCGDQLTGGARINYIFHDWFGKALAQFDPLDGLSDLEIRTAIR